MHEALNQILSDGPRRGRPRPVALAAYGGGDAGDDVKATAADIGGRIVSVKSVYWTDVLVEA